ncbi:MAG: hypothetical protein QOE99_2210, partial [Actinomycetota bacterium]|nr:hypothetical protein [Actinomycetota bacterium]
SKKSFIKKASLVNFKLPVTIRLRGSNAASNPNSANLDLGASLGRRQVNLGGSLAAEIVFHDSFDGGALGNVDLSILPSSTKTLTTTSIPLLWNTQVSGGRWDANSLGLPAAAAGCGNFTGNAPLPFGAGLGAGPAPVGGIPQPGGLPGYPFTDPANPNVFGPNVSGFLPVTPGVDDPNNLTVSGIPGDNYKVGANPDPFPQGAPSEPGGFANPTAKDTVLRTNALSLTIATPGTPVNGSTNADGLAGSQNSVIGASGGQANLFGNIPGKSYGIDVTVNLATTINSILRITDQDSFGSPLITGASYPAGIFNCRQVRTGGIQNYIPSVHLTGGLRIAPGITSDGKLRIAKATISTPNTGTSTADRSHFGVAACLAPYAGVDAQLNQSDLSPLTNPLSKIPPASAVDGSGPPAPFAGYANLPADVFTSRPAPAAGCNAAPTGLVAQSALAPSTVQALSGANNITDGYTVSNSGSAVSIAADLDVTNVAVDVLVGDV